MAGDKMYFWTIAFGFLLALRGAKPAPLQKPVEGLKRVGRETVDFFLTTSLVLTLWAAVAALDKTRLFAQTYAVLGLGVLAYGSACYQKKTDLFFLSVLTAAFMVHSNSQNLLRELSRALALSAGLAIFQACFLGLRYKLLFSDVPASMKGWPVLTLLAGFISMVLWSLRTAF